MKQFNTPNTTWLAALALSLLAIQGLSAQEPDSGAEQDDVEVILDVVSDADQETSSDDTEANQDGEQEELEIQVVSQDGKVVIVDAKGNRHEVPGSQNMIILRGSGKGNDQRIIVTPEGVHQESDRRTNAHAILVGPDGKQLRIDLALVPDDDQGRTAKLRTTITELIQQATQAKSSSEQARHQAEQQRLMAAVIRAKFEEARAAAQANRPDELGQYEWAWTAQLDTDHLSSPYLIGVHCEPVGEALRDHLGLEEGVGLLVEKVWDDLPAGKAGLQHNDILIRVGDQDLTDVTTMVKAIDAAGKEGQSLSFILIRKGKEQKLDIEPTKREQNAPKMGLLKESNTTLDMIPSLIDDENGGVLLKMAPALKIEQAGPGLIVETEDALSDALQAEALAQNANASLKTELEQLRQQMREMQVQMREMVDQLKSIHDQQDK